MTYLRVIVVALCVGWLALPALAETRLALVITNQAYSDDIGRLANSHRDGALIVDALKSVGFEAGNIAVVKDADQPAMRLALADFVERLEKAGPDAVAFLYYSGHGAADRTERGENYLIPVGARITVAKQLPILGVGLSEIAKAIERVPAKARFIVVDACRNVAFTKGLKDAAKGFVPERKLDGMIVAFATRPGETADDNNVYAGALASILPMPGLRAEEVFKETQLKVAELSRGNQVPWTEDGLLTRFRFRDGVAATALTASGPLQAQPDVSAVTATGVLQPQPKVAMVAPKPPAPTPAPKAPPATAGDPALAVVPGSGQSFRDCANCPEMVVVPRGSFTMGSPDSEEHLSGTGGHEGPQHTVTIPQPFAVGKFAVTFTEWEGCVAGGGCTSNKVPRDQGWGRGKRPVINISWNDAKAYVSWLSAKTGWTYRLLSEAEREYVTRGGTTTPFWWGSTISPSLANYNGAAYANGATGGNRGQTLPVDSFDPNPWGLHQVHGNIYEWTEDCWHASYEGSPPTDGSAWITTCTDDTRRVVRGGSWYPAPVDLRSARRDGVPDGLRNIDLGLRVGRMFKP